MKIGPANLPSLWAILPRALKTLGQRLSAQALAQDPSPADSGRPAPGGYVLDGPVAVIPVVGPLSKRGDWECSSMRDLAVDLAHAADNPAVRAILLDVDSPGGTVDGIEELALAATAAAARKPLYAWADGCMCSAAYWLSCAAREIAAGATAEVGSIGVVLVHWEISKAAEMAGFTFNVISAGRYKAVGNMVEPLSEEGRAVLQADVDGIYALFLEAVASGRKMDMDMDKALAMADGRVFLGREALAAGLIDRVESREAFVNHIKEAVHMDLSTLKKQEPAALAEFRAEVEAEAAAKFAGDRDKAVAGERERCIGVMSALLGPEASQGLAGLINANVNADQASALAASLGILAPAAGAGKPDKSGEMLSALQAAHGSGVKPLASEAGAGADQDFDALVAARMQETKCSKGAAFTWAAKAHPAAHKSWLAKRQGQKEG